LIVNCVVLTSVCSCFNSSLYTASRMLFSLAGRGDAHRIMARTANGTGTPYVAVVISSVFAFTAVYMMASSKMDLYDVLMQTTGCVALLVYLTIACCQLRMRRQLEAQGVELKLKMWLFPWLTWAVIAFVIGALVTMTVEGTYRAEVLSTSCLAAVIVIMGLIAQRYGIGKGKAHTTKNSLVC
jgi:GABA permease